MNRVAKDSAEDLEDFLIIASAYRRPLWSLVMKDFRGHMVLTWSGYDQVQWTP